MVRTGRLLAAALSTLVFALLALSASCGSGYSEEDATTFCDQEKVSLAHCFTDAVYTQCKSCYEDCGAGCDRAHTCPEQYKCKE